MMERQARHPIRVVERDTGIGRDTLRIWERRYGFPLPSRNDRGERVYDDAQLRRLQRIRRLLDQGVRPGKILPMDDQALDDLEAGLADSYPTIDPSMRAFIEAVAAVDHVQLHRLLAERYQAQGMRDFIKNTVAPLVYSVGEYWASGRLQIYQEHFLTAQLIAFINAELARLPEPSDTSTVLLMTLPGEQHTLGLLMVYALLLASGKKAVNLGAELPMDQLVRAVQQIDPVAVGLTFSAAYSYKLIRAHLHELRNHLAREIEIWVGGDGVQRMRKLPAGVVKFTTLDQLKV